MITADESDGQYGFRSNSGDEVELPVTPYSVTANVPITSGDKARTATVHNTELEKDIRLSSPMQVFPSTSGESYTAHEQEQTTGLDSSYLKNLPKPIGIYQPQIDIQDYILDDIDESSSDVPTIFSFETLGADVEIDDCTVDIAATDAISTSPEDYALEGSQDGRSSGNSHFEENRAELPDISPREPAAGSSHNSDDSYLSSHRGNSTDRDSHELYQNGDMHLRLPKKHYKYMNMGYESTDPQLQSPVNSEDFDRSEEGRIVNSYKVMLYCGAVPKPDDVDLGDYEREFATTKGFNKLRYDMLTDAQGGPLAYTASEVSHTATTEKNAVGLGTVYHLNKSQTSSLKPQDIEKLKRLKDAASETYSGDASTSSCYNASVKSEDETVITEDDDSSDIDGAKKYSNSYSQSVLNKMNLEIIDKETTANDNKKLAYCDLMSIPVPPRELSSTFVTSLKRRMGDEVDNESMFATKYTRSDYYNDVTATAVEGDPYSAPYYVVRSSLMAARPYLFARYGRSAADSEASSGRTYIPRNYNEDFEGEVDVGLEVPFHQENVSEAEGQTQQTDADQLRTFLETQRQYPLPVSPAPQPMPRTTISRQVEDSSSNYTNYLAPDAQYDAGRNSNPHHRTNEQRFAKPEVPARPAHFAGVIRNSPDSSVAPKLRHKVRSVPNNDEPGPSHL